MAHQLEDIRERLLTISEELADVALERLRAEIHGAEDDSLVDEKRITRARRAVEKAANLLEEPVADDWTG